MDVTEELGIQVEYDNGLLPLGLTLSYDPGDPYSVRAWFHVGTGEPVKWEFARSLLASGLSAPAGDGDVRVCPGGSDTIALTLSPPDFVPGRFLLPRARVARFLARTYEAVPAGTEARPGEADFDLTLLQWSAEEEDW